MSSEVENYGMDRQLAVSPEQVELIKNTLAKGATDDELKLFIYECQRRGIHPMDRLIHFVKRGQGEKAKVTFQASIDYLRMRSDESGDYAGIDEPVYGELNADGFPEWAKVTVYRFMGGHRVGFTGVARWKEFYPGEDQGFMWRKMSHHMLAKTAEAQARRLANPHRLAGLYIPEEMAQADAVDVTPPKKTDTVKPPQTTTPPKDTKPVKDKLKEELLEYCAGDMDRVKEVLKEASTFIGQDGKPSWITSLEKASDKWCATTLGKLRKMQNPGKPEDCTESPDTCDHSTWMDGGKAFCTAMSDKACPYWREATI